MILYRTAGGGAGRAVEMALRVKGVTYSVQEAAAIPGEGVRLDDTAGARPCIELLHRLPGALLLPRHPHERSLARAVAGWIDLELLHGAPRLPDAALLAADLWMGREYLFEGRPTMPDCLLLGALDQAAQNPGGEALFAAAPALEGFYEREMGRWRSASTAG
jgi:hypothetical protein